MGKMGRQVPAPHLHPEPSEGGVRCQPHAYILDPTEPLTRVCLKCGLQRSLKGSKAEYVARLEAKTRVIAAGGKPCQRGHAFVADPRTSMRIACSACGLVRTAPLVERYNKVRRTTRRQLGLMSACVPLDSRSAQLVQAASLASGAISNTSVIHVTLLEGADPAIIDDAALAPLRSALDADPILEVTRLELVPTQCGGRLALAQVAPRSTQVRGAIEALLQHKAAVLLPQWPMHIAIGVVRGAGAADVAAAWSVLEQRLPAGSELCTAGGHQLRALFDLEQAARPLAGRGEVADASFLTPV
mmetsp:Transcript_45661/g.111179  ORF Transcript_45661/g.111179 Transcript_45661/m.111179 type:complete len:301 (+) Transcript_45661:39-941(+)